MKDDTEYMYLLGKVVELKCKLEDYTILVMYLLFKLGGQQTVRTDELAEIIRDFNKLSIKEVNEGWYLKLMSAQKETK